ncbi:MAG: diguanylate cyclase [Actinomycetales bacterium]|nr:diguanylate cyclase [Actinomycetales bacterium]
MTLPSGHRVMVLVTGWAEYQARLVDGIAPVLQRRGIPCHVHMTGWDRNRPLPFGLQDMIRAARPTGIIVTTMDERSKEEVLLDQLSTLGVPVVLIGYDRPGALGVRGDNVSGMRELMAHVLDDCGARRLMLVRGVPHQLDSIEREGVFREELLRRGLSVEEGLVVDGHFLAEIAFPAVCDLLRRDRAVDAVVALNDRSAVGVLDAISHTGLRVPGDVLVTGFDDDEVASLSWPGLTTVAQDLEGQGAAAADLLLRVMDGERVSESVQVPSRVVIRGSTRAPAVVGDGGDAEQTAIRLASGRVAAQDALLSMSYSLLWCDTVEEVGDVLATAVTRLGLLRCFLVLREQPLSEDNGGGGTDPGRLVLDYRDGKVHPVPPGTFPVARLLPDVLSGELDRDVLTSQALRVGVKELGYLLFEAVPGTRLKNFMVQAFLSRAIESVFTTRENERYTSLLEQAVAQRTRDLEEVNARLERSLMLDGLTQIANRLAFQRRIEECWQAAAVNGGAVALLMIDVDLFKPYNDHYGHVQGDRALQTVAECLERTALHEDDLACRYGGEEFAVLLPSAGLRGATAVASRFRDELARRAVPHAASSVSSVLTVSVGIAVRSARPDLAAETLVEAADAALYDAKISGRDRVVVNPDSVPAPGAGPRPPRQRRRTAGPVPPAAVPRAGRSGRTPPG